MAAKELTDRQKKVLEWIVDGCADNPPYETFKTTARMLEGHGLVKISGRGAAWKAVATKRGERVYDGTEALFVKKKRGKGAASSVPVPRPHVPVKPPVPPEPKIDLEPYVQKVLSAIEQSDLDAFWCATSESELKRIWIPVGKTLVKNFGDPESNIIYDYVATQPGYWRTQGSFKVGKLQLEPLRLPDWRELIRGEKRVAKYHPAVKTTFEWRKEKLSPDVYARAKRVLHVVFTLFELYGGTVEVDQWYNDWSKKTIVRGVSAGIGSLSKVLIREGYDKSEREPTKEEIEKHNRWHKGEPMRRFYNHIPNGQLTIEVGYGLSAHDTKHNPNGIENGIERYFMSLRVRDFWYGVNAELSRRRKEFRERQSEFAQRIAAKTVAKDFYFDVLYMRSQELNKFEAVRDYVDFIKRNEPESPWITWAEKYLDTFDPRHNLAMPNPPALDVKAHSGLIEKIIDILGEDESTWPDAFPDGEFHGRGVTRAEAV